MGKAISIYDTTLRDGAQAEEISFSAEDKWRIARALDDLGVGYLEAGNPGSNPKDLEFFKLLAAQPLTNAVVTAFGSTRRKGISVDEDMNLKALLGADTRAVAIFGKSWDFHVTQVIQTTLDENLRMIEETVRYFKDRDREVIFDAEHFFDGYAGQPRVCPEVPRGGGRGRSRLARPLRHERRRLPRRGPGDHPRRGGAVPAAARHPLPRRRRHGRRQLGDGGRGRRHPGSGHLHRVRRALRQREPLDDHPQPAVEEGLCLHPGVRPWPA